jgi:hypothetical protein
LTTKFTRCTASLVVRRSPLGEPLSNLDAITPPKFYSATLLLARLDMFTCSANCKIPRFARDDNPGRTVISFEEVLRTPAGTAALIKIYFALYLPNLFSCQSSYSPAYAG